MQNEQWQGFPANGKLQRHEDSQHEPTASVVFAGDWLPEGLQIEALRVQQGSFYGDMLSVFEQAALSVVNLELTITDAASLIIKDGPVLSLPPEFITAFAAFGTERIAAMANNHMLDYGPAGLRQTLSLLDEAGIPHLGAGMTLEEARQPMSISLAGKRLALLNAAEGEEAASTGGPGAAPFDIDFLCEQVAALRLQHDLVIVVMHAGREFYPAPPPFLQQAYRSLIAAGADVVVGHHPHVPQGLEYCDRGVIAYSLGNLVNSPPKDVQTDWRSWGYLLRVNLCDSGIHSVEALPYHIRDDGLELIHGGEHKRYTERLYALSQILNPLERNEQVWEAYVDAWIQRELSKEISELAANMASYQHTLPAARHSLGTLPGVQGKLVRRFLSWVIALVGRWDVPAAYRSEAYRKNAAVLLNRFKTRTHRELYSTALNRIIEGKVGSAAQWAANLIDDWGIFE